MRIRRKLAIRGIGLVIMVAPAFVVPRWWCGREARALFDGERDAHERLARGVVDWLSTDLDVADFSTGSSRFDGEWLFGTHQMAALGLLQLADMHPELAGDLLPAVERCIERLLSRDLRRFDTVAWSADPLETLAGDDGHAAYLGYTNLVLGLYREQTDRDRFAETHDAISASLRRRLGASPIGLLETYPGEVYPVDNSAVLTSLAVHERVTGGDGAQVAGWIARLTGEYVDPESGLLIQAVDARSGEARDLPRASGTALAAYFVSFVDREASRRLYDALLESCATSFLGFGLMAEYPEMVDAGRGDIDSGPVVFGMSFSGTGFAIASSRVHGDFDTYRALYRTAYIVGVPADIDGERSFVLGGPLGNAILLAMLTAGGAA